jgi:secreted trypsin-like serine protease
MRLLKIVSYFLIAFFFANSALALDKFEFNPRVIGGGEAGQGNYPFMAGIFFKGVAPIDGHICGAVLIHPEWVATTASCFYDSADNLFDINFFEIGLGFYDLSKNDGTLFKIKEVIEHPDFDISTKDNDFALVKLDSAVEGYKPISLATGFYNDIGENATFLGWGYTVEEDFSSKPDVLQKIEVPIFPNSICEKAFDSGKVTDSMLCAGLVSGEKDFCEDDWGGPLFVDVGGEHILVGLSSWNEGCGTKDKLGVYARFASFWPFVEANTPLRESDYLSVAQGRVYGLWNGNDGMMNVLELLNTSDETKIVEVTLFSMSGEESSNTIPFQIRGKSQLDIVLDEKFTLPLQNQYGTLVVQGGVTGRVVNYKFDPEGKVKYSSSNNLFNKSRDEVFFSLNLNNADPTGSSSKDNWLTLVADDNEGVLLEIRFYNYDGEFVDRTFLALEAGSRFDYLLVSGLFNGRVGLVKVRNFITNSRFAALPKRVAYDPKNFPSIENLTGVSRKAFSDEEFYISLSARRDQTNGWLEIANGPNENKVKIDYFLSSGELAYSESLQLNPNQQRHIYIRSAYDNAEFGFARIRQEGENVSLVVDSLYYHHTTHRSFTKVTAVSNREAVRGEKGTIYSNYNTFLNQDNLIKISNPNDKVIKVEIEFYDSLKSVGKGSIDINPYATHAFNASALDNYNLLKDSYGLIKITSQEKIVPIVLRRKNGSIQDIWGNRFITVESDLNTTLFR